MYNGSGAGVSIKAASICYGSSVHMARKRVHRKVETDKEEAQINMLAVIFRPLGLLWMADRFGVGQPYLDMMGEKEDEQKS
jgi:hypothetical protein